MSPWTESVCSFDCSGSTLIGVIAQPAGHGGAQRSKSDIGVVIVVGGPQTRIGAHRRFVTLARSLAGAGFPTLRFDLRGMGDSEGEPPGFEDSGSDIAAAMLALQGHCPDVRRVVLWGLCDGATAAVLAWGQNQDHRIAALCLVNPWVRTPTVQASTQVQRYYGRRLRDPTFWKRVFSGQVGMAAVADWRRAWRQVRAGPIDADDFTDQMAMSLQSFEGPVLVVLSGRDHTAREFEWLAQSGPRWRGLLGRSSWTRIDHPEADHTHSGDAAGEALRNDVLGWMRKHFGGIQQRSSEMPS